MAWDGTELGQDRKRNGGTEKQKQRHLLSARPMAWITHTHSDGGTGRCICMPLQLDGAVVFVVGVVVELRVCGGGGWGSGGVGHFLGVCLLFGGFGGFGGLLFVVCCLLFAVYRETQQTGQLS